ncbi:hypothetical protein A1O1_04492 [Capronia coronata CBS 617.96]|uniref:Uncharacterized protein n=1 Tax=Capronia coronata CBS 617.96 TaxID=1182541 RepID=W9YP09_9EURO|nr:uncharacterized protein A1O1_04492 [Capronia coronata CBS 617.96]EXJ91380.1 hypothetical protein A1O1_04492 [Capronia coronata CBS 617.96]
MTTRAAFTLLLFASSVLSFVLPIPHAQPPQRVTDSYNNALHKLNPMQQTNNLVCRVSRQSMSCYGGPAVTLQTCQSTCTCENGRISCPSYKYCDDSTMDTFCGGLCQCAGSGSSGYSSPGSSSQGGIAKPKPNRDSVFVMSPHRYSAPSRKQVDDDDDFGDDDDDDDLRKRKMKRTTKRSTDIPMAGASL